ncbi:alpha/beta fold hydrolase [Massilia sp. CCM 8695]|uniref:Alpha/beta fold hydrolase n=1 Tax=Massilia frigida TaxID=2609281 RepID=A0ABX0NHH0_9BURK|nr:alpha/beta fold hydrolase [Massilia frigida]
MAHLHTVLFSAMLASAPALAAEPAALRDYRGLAISADGKRIAALESLDPGGLPLRPHAIVVVRDAASGAILAQYDPCATCTYDHPAWSPDRQSLAFISADARAGSATVYVAGAAGAMPVASLKGVASSVRWSPDGKLLSLLATPGAKKLAGAVEAGARQIGEIGTQDDAQRLALVAAHGGELAMLSPSDSYIYEYDWTPDGKGFAVTSAKGNGDNNWWVATLGHVDAASGALRVLAAPRMQMTIPRVSPDGRSVAFIGGLMSDFGAVGGDVYTVPLTGGEPHNVTPRFAGSFNGLAWQGRQLLASALVGSAHAVLGIDPAKRSTRTLWSGAVGAAGARQGRFVFSADGAIAASVHEDFTRAPRIVAGRLPQLAAITRDNDAFAPQVRATSVEWSNEGFNMQGWLLAPLATEPGKKYPMVVQVHGGPASAASPRFVSDGEQANPLLRDLARKGYYVFLPNPRGSFGQGMAFSSANKRDFGGGDWRDILAGVDAVLKLAPVDAGRLGLMGHSYGGFMTMWGVTHSDRFKAAVAGAGIANWISYYGQNGIDQWMIPFFGASAYDDPAAYRAASPIESIKAAKTPTLLYVGERDVETPAVQSMEFWHGLRAMGTPTALVIYDGEGHAIRKPAHQRDQRARTVAWFERYLK